MVSALNQAGAGAAIMRTYGGYADAARGAQIEQARQMREAANQAGIGAAQARDAGANAFGAARLAQRGLQAQQGQIRQETTGQLNALAMAEAQRREQEMLRKQQEARAMVGGLLSTGGAVLGTAMGGMGGGIGGSLGGGIGSALTGGGGPAVARAGQMAQPQTAQLAAPGAVYAPLAPMPPGGGGRATSMMAPPGATMGAMGGPAQAPETEEERRRRMGGGGMLGGIPLIGGLLGGLG